MTDAERAALLSLARARNIAEGSAAERQLNEWLTHRPADKVFASASGGMLGIHRVSSEERALIASITSELKGRTN